MDLFSTKPIEAPQRQFIRLFVTCGQKQFIATVDRTSQNLDTQIADSYAQACFENSQIDDMLVHQFKVKNIKQSGYQVVIPRSMQIGHVLDDQSYISCEIIDLRRKIHVKVEQSGNSKNKNKQEKEEKKINVNLPDISPPRTVEQNDASQKTPKAIPQKKEKNQNKQKQNQPQINKQQIEEEKPKPQQNIKEPEIQQEIKDDTKQTEQSEKKDFPKVDEQASKIKEVIKDKPKESKELVQIQEEAQVIPDTQPPKDQGKNLKKQQQQSQQIATTGNQENDEVNFGTKKMRKLNNDESAINVSKEIIPPAPNQSFQQNVEHTQKTQKQNNNNQPHNKQIIQNTQNQQQQQQQKNNKQQQNQQNQNPQPQQKQQQKPQQPVKKINKVITTACDTDEESDENPQPKPKFVQPQKQGKKVDKKHSIDFDNNLFENC